jgi:hypothetical protein
MAETGLPVFSIESHSRNYWFVRARFWGRRNIKILHGDSRTVLLRLLDGPLHHLSDCPLFFYLDAHWNEDLPLVEEIDIVFRRCPSAVVMVDDFRVPSDDGYGYDHYGPGKALTSDYIRPAVLSHQLQAFYPSTPAAAEGGARRGCVLLTKEPVQRSALASVSLLRPAGEGELESTR